MGAGAAAGTGGLQEGLWGEGEAGGALKSKLVSWELGVGEGQDSLGRSEPNATAGQLQAHWAIDHLALGC